MRKADVPSSCLICFMKRPTGGGLRVKPDLSLCEVASSLHSGHWILRGNNFHMSTLKNEKFHERKYYKV